MHDASPLLLIYNNFYSDKRLITMLSTHRLSCSSKDFARWGIVVSAVLQFREGSFDHCSQALERRFVQIVTLIYRQKRPSQRSAPKLCCRDHHLGARDSTARQCTDKDVRPPDTQDLVALTVVIVGKYKTAIFQSPLCKFAKIKCSLIINGGA